MAHGGFGRFWRRRLCALRVTTETDILSLSDELRALVEAAEERGTSRHPS